jgi:hypothetical protein
VGAANSSEVAPASVLTVTSALVRPRHSTAPASVEIPEVPGQVVHANGAGLSGDLRRHGCGHADPVFDVAAGLVVSAAGLGEPQRLALDLVGCGGLGSRVAVLLGDRDRAVHAKFPATGTRQCRLARRCDPTIRTSGCSPDVVVAVGRAGSLYGQLPAPSPPRAARVRRGVRHSERRRRLFERARYCTASSRSH